VVAVLILFPCWQLLSGLRHTHDENAGFHPYLQLKPQDIALTADEIIHTYKVFCLGGSTTEFKNRQGQDWPALVEKNVQQKLKRDDIRFFNQGKQWYTTLHSLINYETNLRPLKPQVIIVMHTINDLLHNADFSYFSQHEFRADYGHFAGPVSRLIDTKSFITKLASKWNQLWYFKPRKLVTQDTFKGEAAFAANLNTIIDLAQLDHVKVVLMSQPSLYKENPDPKILPLLYMLNNEAIGRDKQWTYQTALNGFMRYKEIIAGVARARNVAYIDLDSLIPKTPEYFYDDVHYTDKAYPLLAQAITEHLLALKVFD
jgi:lysophospholipase L1-like esterase